jgi:hypothetical protein
MAVPQRNPVEPAEGPLDRRQQRRKALSSKDEAEEVRSASDQTAVSGGVQA